MIFEISRTSGKYRHQNPEKPCAEAVRLNRPNVERCFCTEEEYDKNTYHRNGPWRSKGTNHSITARGISRELEMRDVWCVEIETLEDLVALTEKWGDSIIVSADGIEIYDDYRE